MSSIIRLGPLLGIESECLYTVCLLTEQSVTAVTVIVDGKSIKANKAGESYSGIFWRAECTIPPSNTKGRSLSYSIKIDNVIASDKNSRESWKFYVPTKLESPKLAYASCNGFSDPGLKSKITAPYHLWSEMRSQHDIEPFSLLLMGGDQLYADSIWSEVTKLVKWSDLSWKKKIESKATKVMTQQVDRFYEKLYIDRWSSVDMSFMLASVPSIMMWDDHDIFDGWGSYPQDIHECAVYQMIFTQAQSYFEMFQIRSKNNNSLLDDARTHYGFSFSFRGYHILALDNRSDRTLKEVMSSTQWTDIKKRLSQLTNDGDLLLLTALPVVYRDFSLSERFVDITPWEEELTDDLKDHWRAKEHQGERARLIMNLLDNGRQRKGRTVMLSGDVHVGCIGVINDRRKEESIKIHQVVSSGIVHPAPGMIEWAGIKAVTNDVDEYLNEEHTIEISMLKPYGSYKYIRARNFVTLQEGTDSKLWINWVSEGRDEPVYPLDK